MIMQIRDKFKESMKIDNPALRQITQKEIEIEGQLLALKLNRNISDKIREHRENKTGLQNEDKIIDIMHKTIEKKAKLNSDRPTATNGADQIDFMFDVHYEMKEQFIRRQIFQ